MDADFFEFKDDYTLLRIRTTTKASKNAISGIKNNRLCVSVTTVPENGKANESVIKLLSEKFKCAKSKIQVIYGEKSRDKIIRIDGILENLNNLSMLNTKNICSKNNN